MIRVARGAKVIVMAACTLDRCAHEVIAQLVLVTGIAVCRRMDSREWKSQRRVLLENVVSVFPAFGGVTPLALCSEFAAVDVAVTIGALILGFKEFQIGVAGNARCLLVSTDERKTGVVMVESAISLHLCPGVDRMTGLAFEIDLAMRVARSDQ